MAKRRVFQVKSDEEAAEAAQPQKKQKTVPDEPAAKKSKTPKAAAAPAKSESPKQAKEKQKAVVEDKPAISISTAPASKVDLASTAKISEHNATKNPARRFYTMITSDTLKDLGFRNLRCLYIGSFLWDQTLWKQFEATIKLMPNLETLVVKDPFISVELFLENKTIKNFGLYARGLKKLDIKAPQLESLTIVHTLSCGTGFFADLMIDTPNLKYINLWENYGIIQVTTTLDHLETMILSRTSVTKLSCDNILENFPNLKTLYISSIDVNARTISAWKKKYDTEVHLEANRDFFNEYLLYLDDFDNLSLFHEEQKY